MPPVMTDGCERAQFEPAHRGDDIESGLAFDADRLKGERVVEPTDQPVSGGSDTHRGSAGSADISAGQRTCAECTVAAKTAQLMVASLVNPICAPKRWTVP